MYFCNIWLMYTLTNISFQSMNAPSTIAPDMVPASCTKALHLVAIATILIGKIALAAIRTAIRLCALMEAPVKTVARACKCD